MTLTWQQIHKDIHLHEDGAISITEPFTGNLVSISLDILEYPDNRQILGYLIQFSGIAEKRYPLFSAKEVLFFAIPQTDRLKFIPTAYLQEIYELEINISSIELSGNGTTSSISTIADIIGLQTALNGKASLIHGHTIANITGLNDVLDDHEERIDAIELATPSSPSSISLDLIDAIANQSLEVNKNYFVVNSGLILTLPNTPVIGDYIRVYNGNFDARINHGNASQKIKNNTTDTLIGIDNGIILKPYSCIELIYVGSDLWVSTIRIRSVNNYQVPIPETIATQKSYIPLALESYSYYAGMGLNKINDGNNNDGVMKVSGGIRNTFILSATLQNNTELNQLRINCGQFNGDFNMPTTVQVYKGNEVIAGNLIATFNNIHSPNNSLHTIANPVSDSVFTFEFSPASSNISIRELTLFGKGVIGGEITVS